MEIIDQTEFAAATLNADDKTFVVHVPDLAEPTTMPIYSSSPAQVAALMSEETVIPVEYSNFFNVFFSDSAAELPEHTGINDYLINLLDNKQLPYSPIYSLRLVELKTLKTYIKVNLASSFIRSFKSPSGVPILFVRKKDASLRLCINY